MGPVLASTVRIYKQWLFSPDGLLRTPSSEDGYSLDAELNTRQEACTFATRVALTLQPPSADNVDCHLVAASAAVFIHRFYMRASVKDHHPHDIGPVCLFLAGKDSEKAFRMSQIASVTLQKKRRGNQPATHKGDPPVDTRTDPEAIALIKRFLALEETVASTLCWEFIPGLPYQPYALGIRRLLASQQGVSQRVLCTWLQVGWAFINDSIPTPLAVLQPPSVIASAAYVLAASALGFATIEQSLDTFHDWKRHFGIGDDDVEEDEVKDEEDVEECFLWMAQCQTSTRKQPEFAMYKDRRPKPFPAPAVQHSTLPSPHHPTHLIPTPAGLSPYESRSPARPAASPSHPSSRSPAAAANGRNPYEPPPPETAVSNGVTSMDVDQVPLAQNGAH